MSMATRLSRCLMFAFGLTVSVNFEYSFAKPNIVLFVADDLGYAEVGCYGQKIIRTPNIDGLARDGMRFTQFYSGSPVCAPSRCVLMTGFHSGHAFIRDNREHKPEGQLPIPDETVTIAELLQEHGYATAAIGKWGLGFPGSSGDPNKQGFDLFFGYNCQRHAHNHFPRYLWRNGARVPQPGNNRELNGEKFSQDEFTREALDFIKRNKEQPFFLYMPFAIPHLSIQVPEESLAEYRGKIPEADYEHRGYLRHPYPHAGYAAMVTHMDRDIGKILGLLDDLNLAENTLVMFTSDNGPTFNRLGGADSDFFNSSGQLRGRKGSVYEGGIRVPMVARWPKKIAKGTETNHISGFQDILPTVMESIGEPSPTDIDGLSFLPTLTGDGKQIEHAYLVWHFPSYGGQQAIRMGKWKAVRKNIQRAKNRYIELYDLSVDIGENHDVSGQNRALVDRISNIFRESQSPSNDFPLLAIDR